MKKEPERGLMYVDFLVNGKTSRAMVDTEATDTFISPLEAMKCGLEIAKNISKMKAVNSAVSSICVSVKKAVTKLGSWEGSVDFIVTSMDDFDVVLGLDFMTPAQVILIPTAGYLLFLGESSCVTAATILSRSGKKMLSAIQFKKGVKKVDPSFVVLPICKYILPRRIRRVLEDHQDVKPDQLPYGLPPRSSVDHEIELISCTKPPARCTYRMSLPELAELRKQLDKLFQDGFIRPSKA
ncbi:hypothetical protein V6N13_135821 [Hibiscus sabdariffa]